MSTFQLLMFALVCYGGGVVTGACVVLLSQEDDE